MTTPTLQEFLRLRLLDIGPDDSRLEKLGAVAAELSETFAANPKASLSTLLAAWDPGVGEDPALLRVGQVVEKHWPTFRSAFHGEPITLYRAIALEAFSQAVERQSSLAVAVYYLSSNLLQHIPVGKEASVLAALVERAEQVVVRQLNVTWAFSSQPFVPQMPTLPKAAAKKKASKEYYLPRVEAAVGPSDRDGAANESPNSHWPNAGPPWSYDFSDRITAVLLDLHDSATATAVAANGEANSAVMAAVDDVLNQVAQWVVPQTEHVNRMTTLLWWRQALYSELANKAYRVLSPELAAIYMALDMAKMLPAAYPRAVESFLAEAVLALLPERQAQTSQIPMGAFFKVLVDFNEKPLSEALTRFASGHAERSLMLQTANKLQSGEGFAPSRLGIDENFTLSIEQWAIWLLREIKALEALAEVRLDKQVPNPSQG